MSLANVTKSTNHKSLTIDDVQELGCALISVADLYPLQYRTERDFFPLVVAYLYGRIPKVDTEVSGTDGRIDFRIGGLNPAVLEIAVCPRRLKDADLDAQKFPGHIQGTQLYATQNRPEIKKLKAVPQTKARNRFLLLLDLPGTTNISSLQSQYEKELPPGKGGAVVRTVYVSRNTTIHFRLGGKMKKGK